jgi:ATP-binding cassette subfamily B protein
MALRNNKCLIYNHQKNLFGFLWHFVKKQKIGFLTLAIAHLAWAIEWTLVPYAFKLFLDVIINFSGDKSQIWQIALFPILLGGGLWLLTETMFRVYDFTSAYAYPKFLSNIRLSMFDYVQRHSYDYFSNNFSGSLANKISDIADGSLRILTLIAELFIPSLVAFAIALSIFATIAPEFALLMLVWIAIHIGLSLLFAKRCSKLSFAHSESRSTLSGKIVDSLSNNLNTRLFSRHRQEAQQIHTQLTDTQNKHGTTLRLIAKIRIAQGSMCFLITGILMVYLLVNRWQADLVSTAEVTYIFYTSWNITIMAWISGSEMPNLFKEIGICKQGLATIMQPHELIDAPNAKKLKITKGEIVFDDVSFNYQRNNNLFSKQSMTIKAGESVGLVGFSGSGKTTFVRLILRLFEIQKGRILIDKQNIAKVTQDSLHQQIAMIPQDPILYHRSITENISYGNLKASDAEIIKAAKQADCHEFIMELEQGYETLVGERGVKLSGGQRQRISFARAILKDAPILILDEATSALDSVTEKTLQDSLEKLMQKRTTIIIAHRLSTLAKVDRIIVFDQGHIIEEGTHSQLLKQKGNYAKMWNMQAGGFLPS